MMYRNVPHFVIKKNLQKSLNTGVYFSDVLTTEVLRDVCKRITGAYDYTFNFVDNDYRDDFLEPTYNKGRLAILHYRDEVSYISFSEINIGGRNSSVQSVPTAFNLYYLNPYPNKKLYYFFLDSQGNPETDYHIMMYRLMATIGFTFLNAQQALRQQITAFASVDDIIFNRSANSRRNRSNNSTFITKNGYSKIEIYGKTYGASKYETSMLCYAMAFLCKERQSITLYEVLEQDLRELPQASLEVISTMGVIRVVPTDLQLEKNVFEENDSLRSPRYTYNLLNKFGRKKCILCGCEIPELIQGAHVWPVASIKREVLSLEDKIRCATDGENGLWLCENHHKLFDANIIRIDERSGKVSYKKDLTACNYNFLNRITPYDSLPREIMTECFCKYLQKRNRAV